jgi:GTP-binding protein Era
MYFSGAQPSDQPESVRLGELIREQVLRRTRQEVPHSVEVLVEETGRQKDGLIRIAAVVLAETDSQKGILIGAGGGMIKEIGIAARRSIEQELATRVHLELSVKVRKRWRADEHLLDRLGIE